MKKISTVLIALIAFSTLNAQSIDIRLFGGYNITQLTSDEGTTLIDGVQHQTSVSGRPGAEFGAAVTFGDRFYVQPGIKFVTLTAETLNESTANNTKYEDLTTISTFSIPLKVGMRLINPEVEDKINVRIFGGFDGWHVTSVNHKEKSDKIDDIEKDDFQNLILNADVGMGIDILFLYADLGYEIGLSPVYSTGDNHATANTFYVNLGLRLKL